MSGFMTLGRRSDRRRGDSGEPSALFQGPSATDNRYYDRCNCNPHAGCKWREGAADEGARSLSGPGLTREFERRTRLAALAARSASDPALAEGMQILQITAARSLSRAQPLA